MNFRLNGIGFGFGISLFVITSCCREDSVETARYELTEGELQLIPYEFGQKINFIHSNGYEFDFTVTQDTMEWRTYSPFCEGNCCGLDYISYQVRTTEMESSYPALKLKMTVGEFGYDENYPKFFSLDINHRHFLSIQYDSMGSFICNNDQEVLCHDTISIQNEIFTMVVEKYFDSHYFIDDSTILVPGSALYNNLGLLQIKMSNDETFSIKP